LVPIDDAVKLDVTEVVDVELAVCLAEDVSERVA